MSDRSALAMREETVNQETEDRSQEAADKEQKDAEVAEISGQTQVPEQDDVSGNLTPRDSQDALAPAISQGEREKTAERIRQSEALPVGLRTRLAELVLASDSAAAEQAIRAVEASLPTALRIDASQIARPAHPGGEVFFHGDPDAVSDAAAEALARGQLARSGMLRGQRVRVAE